MLMTTWEFHMKDGTVLTHSTSAYLNSVEAREEYFNLIGKEPKDFGYLRKPPKKVRTFDRTWDSKGNIIIRGAGL